MARYGPKSHFIVQAFFALDRIKALAPSHARLERQGAIQEVLLPVIVESLAAQGEHAILEVIMETHAGLSVDAFKEIVSDWLVDAKHPTLGRNFDSLVFQPMLELLTYMRANGYETWIVYGGGDRVHSDLCRACLRHSAQQVIGSSVVTEFQVVDGRAGAYAVAKNRFYR